MSACMSATITRAGPLVPRAGGARSSRSQKLQKKVQLQKNPSPTTRRSFRGVSLAAAAGEGAAEEKQKKVLVPIADGTEEIEVVTVIDVLRRAGGVGYQRFTTLFCKSNTD